MNWIAKHLEYASNIHYYVGFTSICDSERIASPEPLSYAIKIKKQNSAYCKTCQKILKSEKVQKTIQKREKRIQTAQKKAAELFGVTLQDMLFNRLTSESTKTVNMSELEKLFSADYPQVHLEDILLPLLVSSKVRISGDVIISMEVPTHVK